MAGSPVTPDLLQGFRVILQQELETFRISFLKDAHEHRSSIQSPSLDERKSFRQSYQSVAKAEASILATEFTDSTLLGEGTNQPLLIAVPLDHEAALQEDIFQLRRDEAKILSRLDELTNAFDKRTYPFKLELDRLNFELKTKELEMEHLHDSDFEVIERPGPEALNFVDSSYFDCFCSGMIACNLACMAVELKHQHNPGLALLENIFLIWYVIELILKLYFYQNTFFLGSLKSVCWNWLDLLIVISSITDQWILPIVGLGFMPVNGFRILRLLRLFRIARAMRLLKMLLKSDFKWTEGEAFESFMMVVIMCNCVIMWLELDFAWKGWAVAEHVMLTAYTFELFCRLRRWGFRFFCHPEEQAWNIVDFVIVLMGILEQWALPFIVLVNTLITGKPLRRTGIMGEAVRTLRIIRIVRVLRLVKLVKHVKPLYRLLMGIVGAFQAIAWVMVLTVWVLYAWAIVFRSIVGKGLIFGGDTPRDVKQHYGSVFRTLLSLFRLMNGDISMADGIMGTTTGECLFLLFVISSSWTILATLTSVVSDNMMASSMSLEKEEEADLQVQLENRGRERLLDLFHQLDEEKKGLISEKGFQQLIESDELLFEVLDASQLELEDFRDLFECTSYFDERGQKVVLYLHLIDSIFDHSKTTSERSFKRLAKHMRSMEHRQELRFEQVLRKLGATSAELRQLPSLVEELDMIRKDLILRHLNIIDDIKTTDTADSKGAA